MTTTLSHSPSDIYEEVYRYLKNLIGSTAVTIEELGTSTNEVSHPVSIDIHDLLATIRNSDYPTNAIGNNYDIKEADREFFANYPLKLAEDIISIYQKRADGTSQKLFSIDSNLEPIFDGYDEQYYHSSEEYERDISKCFTLVQEFYQYKEPTIYQREKKYSKQSPHHHIHHTLGQEKKSADTDNT